MFPKGRFRCLVAILFVLGSARWSSSHRRSPVAAVSAVFASPVFATERNKTKQQNILKPLTSHVISIALSVDLAKTHFLPIFCLLKVNKKHFQSSYCCLTLGRCIWDPHFLVSWSGKENSGSSDRSFSRHRRSIRQCSALRSAEPSKIQIKTCRVTPFAPVLMHLEFR